jgi:hypothetical protein
VVSDAAGNPQLGIALELLKADRTLVARVYSDRRGQYSFGSLIPGQYALRAVGGDFLPAIKQNLKVRARTVVNLTMNSLYDLMQWVPQPVRTRARAQDDWAWTLRSAENRPLLRWQEDGSPILVWDGSHEGRPGKARALQSSERSTAGHRKLVRVEASAGGGQFGVGLSRAAVAMRDDISGRRRLLMSAEMAPDTAMGRPGPLEAMMGWRQEAASNGMGSSSIQTLAAWMSDPEAGAGRDQGLQAASLRTWQSMEILDSLEAEAGSEQVLARVGDGREVMAAYPFAKLTVERGKSALSYQVSTARSADAQADEAMPGAWLPILSENDGELRVEHGLHQELGWSTTAGPAELQLIIYGDDLVNPVIEASGHLSAGDEAGQWFLFDRASGLLRSAGPNYSSSGLIAAVESGLPLHNRVRLSYASGDALVMQAEPANLSGAESVGAILHEAHPRRAQMYSIVLSGAADGLGTRWRASYRWQPEATVTEVAPFALDAAEPYLNIYLKQPIRWVHIGRDGPNGAGGLEAHVDLRNLLAEGYQPFVTSDGSHLYFAQAQRCVRGGLAFTF